MRAIIIDDNANNRMVAELLLESLAIDAASCGDVPSALSHVATGEYDVILLDWMMPEIDGIEFLELLRESEAGKAIKVIMCTAKEGEASKQQALNAGADAFLTKPLMADTLKAAIDELISD